MHEYQDLIELVDICSRLCAWVFVRASLAQPGFEHSSQAAVHMKGMWQSSGE